MSVTVAAIQFEPALGQKERNIEQLLRLTEQAARAGAALIVHPEMATSGYCWHSRAEVAPFVEPLPGPTTERFAQLARRFGCYIVLGLPEVAPATGVFYNSAALVGPQGLLGVYRKTHSFIAEPKWAKDGDADLPVFDTPLGRIGIMICMDADFVEPARLLALAGADLIAFPTNWLDDKCPSATWMARAYENGVPIVAANRYGCERGVQFSGGSCVLGPGGAVLASSDSGDGVVLATLDLAAARAAAESRKALRRPALYDTLTLNSYHWNPLAFHGLYGHQPLPPGRRSCVGVCDFTPVPGDLDATMRLLDAALDSPALATAELVVLPEYTLGGNPLDAFQATGITLDIAVAALQALARRHGTTLIAGIAEGADDALFSTALVVSADGLLARYRKVHLAPEERNLLSAGSERPPLLDLPLGRVGLLLGSDLLLPEPARCLAAGGCDLLAVPAAAGLPPVRGIAATAVPLHPPGITEADERHFHLGRQRALENNCYLAIAGVGLSGLFVPAPDRVGEVWGSGSATLDTTSSNELVAPSLVRSKPLLAMRQTRWYDPLQAPGEA